MPGNVRKLAREFVIFCLAGMVIASAMSALVERNKIIAEMSGQLLTGGIEPLWGPTVPRNTDDPVQRILLPAQVPIGPRP